MNKIFFITVVFLILSALGLYITRDRVQSSVVAPKQDFSDRDTDGDSAQIASDSDDAQQIQRELVYEEKDLIRQKLSVIDLVDYAPDFTLAYLDKPDEIFTLSDFRGDKPVIIDFFAEHCPNCRRNLPKMEALHARYGDEVEVILIGIDSETATRRYFQSRPTLLPFVMQDNVVARNYGIRFTNTKALINRDGSLHSMLHGRDITEQNFLDLIDN